MVVLKEVIASFIGTVCFGVIYRAPRRHLLVCGLNGAMVWIIYSLCVPFLSPVMATFVSCFCLTVMSRLLSVLRKAPATVFLITGIFVLVPGAGMYQTIYNIFMHKPETAADCGLITLYSTLAIAFGIVIAYILPQRLFLMFKKKER